MLLLTIKIVYLFYSLIEVNWLKKMVLSFIFDRNRNVCEDIQEIRQIKKVWNFTQVATEYKLDLSEWCEAGKHLEVWMWLFAISCEAAATTQTKPIIPEDKP